MSPSVNSDMCAICTISVLKIGNFTGHMTSPVTTGTYFYDFSNVRYCL